MCVDGETLPRSSSPIEYGQDGSSSSGHSHSGQGSLRKLSSRTSSGEFIKELFPRLFGETTVSRCGTTRRACPYFRTTLRRGKDRRGDCPARSAGRTVVPGQDINRGTTIGGRSGHANQNRIASCLCQDALGGSTRSNGKGRSHKSPGGFGSLRGRGDSSDRDLERRGAKRPWPCLNSRTRGRERAQGLYNRPRNAQYQRSTRYPASSPARRRGFCLKGFCNGGSRRHN
jgi:hypothetical protein